MRMGDTRCTGRQKKIVLKSPKVDISTNQIYDTFTLERYLPAERVFENRIIDITTKQILNAGAAHRFEMK